MAACSLVGAATLYGMVAAAPYVTEMRHGSFGANHPMFADLAQGSLALGLTSGGAGGGSGSGSSASGVGAPRQDAPIQSSAVQTGEDAQAGGYGFAPHAPGVALASLGRIGDISPYSGGGGGGSAGGGFGGMGAGFSSGGGGGGSAGGGGQTGGVSSEDGVGDDLTSLAAASSTQQLKLFASPAPEPSTWTMMIIGLGMLGLALRRRSALAA